MSCIDDFNIKSDGLYVTAVATAAVAVAAAAAAAAVGTVCIVKFNEITDPR